jgi:two-component system, NarL family, nitrate/nitrite response regulator NarL
MEIRVLVASEVRLYREGLRLVLEGTTGITHIDVVSCVEGVSVPVASRVPTVILLDLAMACSLAAAKQLVRRPLYGGIVIFGIPESGGALLTSLPPNILGYVTREASPAELLDAIRGAARGDFYCSRSLLPFIALPGAAKQPAASANFCQLTGREREILEFVREGFTNKMISRELGIGLSTVKNHVHNVLGKLGVRCRSEAIAVLNRHERLERDLSPVQRCRRRMRSRGVPPRQGAIS